MTKGTIYCEFPIGGEVKVFTSEISDSDICGIYLKGVDWVTEGRKGVILKLEDGEDLILLGDKERYYTEESLHDTVENGHIKVDVMFHIYEGVVHVTANWEEK